MITFGAVFLVLALLFDLPVVLTAGGVLLVGGLVLLALGRAGHPVAGRAHYW